MYKCLDEIFKNENEVISEEEKQWDLIYKNAIDRQQRFEADFKRIAAYTMRIQTKIIKKELEEKMNDLIYLIIYKVYNEKRQKWSYYFKRRLYVSGEENLGLQEKTITVVFANNIDKDKYGTGVYVLDSTKHQLPKKYTISIDENGNKKYPYFYISEIENYYPEGVYITNDEKWNWIKN